LDSRPQKAARSRSRVFLEEPTTSVGNNLKKDKNSPRSPPSKFREIPRQNIDGAIAIDRLILKTLTDLKYPAIGAKISFSPGAIDPSNPCHFADSCPRRGL
jgi:hypothetical protein